MNAHPQWRSPLHTIRDSLAFASSPEPIRLGAFDAVAALQGRPPATQLDALFAAAVAMSQALGVDPHDMVTRAKRVLPDLEGGYTMHVQALRDYAREEIGR